MPLVARTVMFGATVRSPELDPSPRVEGEPPEPDWGTGGTINVNPGMGTAAVQAAIDAASSNCTIKFADGTYAGLTIRPKTLQKFEGNPGSPAEVVLNGGAQNRRSFDSGGDGITTGVEKVWITGFKITNYASGFKTDFSTSHANQQDNRAQIAAIQRPGRQWVIENCQVIENYCTGIHWGPAIRIRKCVISHNGSCGVAGRPGTGLCVIEDCDVENNARWHLNKGWESGGLKWVGSGGGGGIGTRPYAGPLIVRRCKLHGNWGPGFWADYGCAVGEIHNCSIYNNHHNGIQLEVSSRWYIHHNQIGDNVRSGTGLFVEEIFFQNTKKCILEDNLIVCTRFNPLKIGQQNRGGQTYPLGDSNVGYSTAHQNVIRNNLFILLVNGGFSILHRDQPTEGSTDIDCTNDNNPHHDPRPDLPFDIGNDFCYVARPGPGNSLSTTFANNTIRLASGSPNIPIAFGATGTTVLRNPAAFVPNWSVLPTWIVPPGK